MTWQTTHHHPFINLPPPVDFGLIVSYSLPLTPSTEYKVSCFIEIFPCQNFRWYRVPQREMDRRNGDRSEPLHTPAMAGGLFAIDRDYFYEVGSYDEGMDIWGGENLEMSFRVWQCGGTLEIIPCSHVGHVFRDKSPYTFPGGVAKIVNKNAARVAEVRDCSFRF